jgi:hypothetical protein
LPHFFDWAYGEDSPLYFADGTHVGDAHTGVKQGDQLGAFFFCYGLQPALLDIKEEVARARDLPNGPPRKPGETEGLNQGGLAQVRKAIDAFNAKLCSTHRRFCIPIVTRSKNSRIQPIAEGEQPRRRGRSRGSRSRGKAQLAAVIVHNSSPNATDLLPVNDHQEADFLIPTALGEE